MLVRQNPKLFQPVLDFFRSGYKSMNFELEAEKISSEILKKKSFVVKKRKLKEPQTDESLPQKLLKKSNIKNHGRKKLAKKEFETQKLSFGASPTLNIGNTS